jgi:hypothetical protein
MINTFIIIYLYKNNILFIGKTKVVDYLIKITVNSRLPGILLT